jgi:hypothetical protein
MAKRQVAASAGPGSYSAKTLTLNLLFLMYVLEIYTCVFVYVCI